MLSDTRNLVGCRNLFVLSFKVVKKNQRPVSSHLTSFLYRISLTSGLSFGIHLLALNFLQLPLFDHQIVLSYILNAAAAVTGFLVLFFLRKTINNQIGLIFFIVSAFKFGLFFVFLYHPYSLDSVITKKEYLTFFIPYFILQTTAIFSLAKWLNKIEC